MKLTGHVEKWAAGVLGAVSLILVSNLVLQFDGVRAGNPHPAPATNVPARQGRLEGSAPRVPDELARYDPSVRLDWLKEFAGRPLPELARNPFEFETQPTAPAPPTGAPTAAPAAPPPAAPPPPPLKPMGYSEKAGGVREAYVADEEQVYVVHEGDPVGKKYKVIKIAPNMVTVEDDTSHQTFELPIPQ
jgi:hypothetical protein